MCFFSSAASQPVLCLACAGGLLGSTRSHTTPRCISLVPLGVRRFWGGVSCCGGVARSTYGAKRPGDSSVWPSGCFREGPILVFCCRRRESGLSCCFGKAPSASPVPLAGGSMAISGDLSGDQQLVFLSSGPPFGRKATALVCGRPIPFGWQVIRTLRLVRIPKVNTSLILGCCVWGRACLGAPYARFCGGVHRTPASQPETSGI